MLEKNEIKNLLRLFTQKKYQAILDLKVYLIDSYPNSVNIHNILGLVHYARKECREAIVCFSEAIKLCSSICLVSSSLRILSILSFIIYLLSDFLI